MYSKIQIKGVLEVKTGMHIGGSSAFSAIGAVHRKRSCSARSEAAKSVCCSALLRRWEQVRMCRTGL